MSRNPMILSLTMRKEARRRTPEMKATVKTMPPFASVRTRIGVANGLQRWPNPLDREYAEEGTSPRNVLGLVVCVPIQKLMATTMRQVTAKTISDFVFATEKASRANG